MRTQQWFASWGSFNVGKNVTGLTVNIKMYIEI